MDKNIYIFLHITLVTLFAADLTPTFSESNYIYPYYEGCKYYVAIALTVTNYYPDLR